MASHHIASIIKFLYPTADFHPENGNVELRDNSDGSGIFINKWTLADPQPTIVDLDAQEVAYLESLASEAISRKDRKTAVLSKMGLAPSDIDALRELIEDKTIEITINQTITSDAEIS